MEYFKGFNSLLFPNKEVCYFCKEKSHDIRDYICGDCRENIEIVNKEILLDSPYMERAYYVSIYNKFMRRLVQEYKFHGKSYLYKPLASLILDNLENMKIDGDMIFYVPSHRKKEAKRGYNQSELLANYIGKNRGIVVSHNNLIKIKNTKAQNKLGGIERRLNLKDSFKLKRPKEIEGKDILLIDDIITTGSTMIECSKELIEGGANRVIGLGLTSSHKL